MVLEHNGPSLQLATAYQRMGWNMLQQANNLEAIRCFQKSLVISTVSGKEYEFVALQSLSSMGVTLTELGNFEDAKRYHFACLERRKRAQGEDHPYVGSTLNNIGLMYSYMEDNENALNYFRQGLDIKRKSNAPIMAIAFSVNNVAIMYMAVRNYNDAHELLDESLRKLNIQPVLPLDALADTYDSKGKVYMREEKYDSARIMFQKALEIREEISSENLPFMESLVHVANVHRRLGDLNKSLRLSKKALKMKDKAIENMPQNLFISECLECIAEIYKMKENSIDKYHETLIQIKFELLRLESVYVSQGNERGLERIKHKMRDVKEKLKTCQDCEL